MLQLTSFPDNIIIKIINYVYGSNSKSYKAPGKHLLQICRRLRYLALPIVYRHAYIVYNSHDKTGKTDISQYNVTNYTTHTMVDTSLDLTSAVECVNYVQTLDIKISTKEIPTSCIQMVINYLESIIQNNDIVQLNLSIYTSEFYSENDEYISSRHSHSLQSIANSIYKLMPHIKELNFLEGNDRLAYILRGMLASKYSRSLTALKSNHEIETIPDLGNSEENEMYSIKYADSHIHASNLKTLQLYNASIICVWAMFSPNSNGDSIEFSSLTDLSLRFHHDDDISMISYKSSINEYLKLKFPRLLKLSVLCYDTLCPILTDADLPSSMDTFEIAAPASEFEKLSSRELPSVKNMRIKVTFRTIENYEGMKHINNILTKVDNANIVDIHISENPVPMVASHFTSDTITNLRIEPLLDPDNLFILLSKLSRLEVLILGNFKPLINKKMVSLLTFSYKYNEPLTPFSAKLKCITLRSQEFVPLSTEIVAMYVFVLAKLPTLEYFRAIDSLNFRLQAEIRGHSHTYTHFNNIELLLDLESKEYKPEDSSGYYSTDSSDNESSTTHYSGSSYCSSCGYHYGSE
ncbi:hypothetical protein BX667DRAFT_505570 [Coemansia mojavensis]|nr:hypothetical protein BX667DRAFT_505570 [Coemansia mojavensis]